jgi:polyketide synthase PksN
MTPLDHQSLSNSQDIIAALKQGRISRPEALTLLKSLSQPADVVSAQTPTTAASSADIAIIGVAGQFPDAPDIDAFWHNLTAGHNPVTEVPPSRLDQARFYDEQKQAGKSYCKWGGVLANRAGFDPLFFNVSPREATSMSPSQRLFLTQAYAALQDGGCSPDVMAGSECSVFVGCEPSGYQHQTFTGSSEAIVASRISYLLDLQGPAFVVNTGCSSSASAIHLACEHLRQSDANNPKQSTAIAGGVFAALRDDLFIALSGAEMLSPSGTCKAFDANADGTVISEGVGAVVLKRLADAEHDGNPILAVIVASGCNQDGKSNGISAPNGLAQQQLIEQTYDRFGIDARQISVIETHGTGTKIGDPIEANALVKAFKGRTKDQRFCALSSVKSNMGHAAAAAGVIGVIKILLCLQHKTLTGLANFNQLNPLVKIDNSPFFVQQQNAYWQPTDSAGQPMPRMAALNTFGHSGTNVHLVIKEYQAKKTVSTLILDEKKPLLFLLSARNNKQLRAVAQRFNDYLGVNTQSHNESEKVEHQQQIVALIADILQLDCAGLVDEPFADLGIDQVQLSQLHQALNAGGRSCNGDIDLNTLLQTANINELSTLLSSHTTEQQPAKSMVEKSPEVLANIAHTLQNGRKALKQRMVLVANTTAQLGHQLTRFLDAEVLVDLQSSIKDSDYRQLAINWLDGQPLDSEAINQHLAVMNNARFVRLPTYPFDNKHFWPSSLAQSSPAPIKQTPAKPLLRQALADESDGKGFISFFDGSEPFLADHQINGDKILPGVVYLEMAHGAAIQVFATQQTAAMSIKDVTWLQPLIVKNQGCWVKITLNTVVSGQLGFKVVSSEHQQGPWLEHCRGNAELVGSQPVLAELPSLQQTHDRCVNQMDITGIYQDFVDAGIAYGASFKSLSQLAFDPQSPLAVAQIVLQQAISGWTMPAGMMDAALQSVIGVSQGQSAEVNQDKETYLPFAIEQLVVYQSLGESIEVVARHNPKHSAVIASYDLDIYNAEQRLCAQIRGFCARAINKPASVKTPLLVAQMRWQPPVAVTISTVQHNDAITLRVLEIPQQAVIDTAFEAAINSSQVEQLRQQLGQLLHNAMAEVQQHVVQHGSSKPLHLFSVTMTVTFIC